MPPSPRLVWAAQVADPQPGERVLEVGCGHGVLLSLVAARLTGGSVLGLDRSATMTAAAAERNAAALAAGTVTLQTAELLAATLDDDAFDLVVAVHVGAFWRAPAAEYATVRRVLADGGRFVLVDQPLQPAQTPAQVDRLAALARPHGLAVVAVRTEDTPPRPCVAVELRVGAG